MDHDEEAPNALHIIVVGFHHKKGMQVLTNATRSANKFLKMILLCYFKLYVMS